MVKAEEVYLADFLCAATYPASIGARVIMTPRGLGRAIQVVETALESYQSKFGPLRPRGAKRRLATVAARAAKPPPDQAEGDDSPTELKIRDLYDEQKSSDRVLADAFADSLTIRHNPEEFCFDFVSNFYPKSFLTARLIIPAGRVPGLLQALRKSRGWMFAVVVTCDRMAATVAAPRVPSCRNSMHRAPQ